MYTWLMFYSWVPDYTVGLAGGVWWMTSYMLIQVSCTVEYWIQQKQPVEFDGFGTPGYMFYSLGYIYTVESWIQQKQPVEYWVFKEISHGYMLKFPLGCTVEYQILCKSSRWSLMDLVHLATCSIHWAVLWSTESDFHWLHVLFTGLHCGVLNPTKAAWWIWLHMLHDLHWAVLWNCKAASLMDLVHLDCCDGSRWSLMDLVHLATCHWATYYCGVLNPTKAAGGVWWIWLHMATWSIHWGTVEYFQQKQPVEFDGFGTWLQLYSLGCTVDTESNKSSHWRYTWLCSIHWATYILWTSNKSSRWSLMDLVQMFYSLGILCHWAASFMDLVHTATCTCSDWPIMIYWICQHVHFDGPR